MLNAKSGEIEGEYCHVVKRLYTVFRHHPTVVKYRSEAS